MLLISNIFGRRSPPAGRYVGLQPQREALGHVKHPLQAGQEVLGPAYPSCSCANLPAASAQTILAVPAGAAALHTCLWTGATQKVRGWGGRSSRVTLPVLSGGCTAMGLHVRKEVLGYAEP